MGVMGLRNFSDFEISSAFPFCHEVIGLFYIYLEVSNFLYQLVVSNFFASFLVLAEGLSSNKTNKQTKRLSNAFQFLTNVIFCERYSHRHRWKNRLNFSIL